MMTPHGHANLNVFQKINQLIFAKLFVNNMLHVNCIIEVQYENNAFLQMEQEIPFEYAKIGNIISVNMSGEWIPNYKVVHVGQKLKYYNVQT